MKKTIRTLLAGMLAVPALAFGVAAVVASDTNAAPTLQTGIDSAQGTGAPGELVDGDESVVTTVVNILLFVVGIIAVIMLIIGGIRYAVSGGDQAAVTAAKNTILYAIIGLVVAIFAYAIVNWVLTSIL